MAAVAAASKVFDRLRLDQPPPARVALRHDWVWAFSGTAWREGARLDGLEIVLGGTAFPARVGVPRIAGAPALDSGFAGLAVLPRCAGPGVHAVEARLRWSDGLSEALPLGRIEAVAAEPPSSTPPPTSGSRLFAVCMATYEPDPALFRAQLESIRGQSWAEWVCLVQDDGSSPARWAAIREAVGDDPRFRLERNAENLGFYRNFEACLARVPVEAAYVALADQDDRWDPDKLAVLAGHLEAGAALAYSNLRLTAPDGRVLAGDFPTGRETAVDDPAALFAANAVTGCAAAFRADLLGLALPFPLAGRHAYHDHWLGCCAALHGGIAYEPRPLAGYVQHGGNALGARSVTPRLVAKTLAGLLLAPAIAAAALVPGLRRRLGIHLALLVDGGLGEHRVRLAFAEALRRRLPGRVPGAVARYGAAPVRTLAGLALGPGRRGPAPRVTALRILAGLAVAGLLSGLCRGLSRTT